MWKMPNKKWSRPLCAWATPCPPLSLLLLAVLPKIVMSCQPPAPYSYPTSSHSYPIYAPAAAPPPSAISQPLPPPIPPPALPPSVSAPLSIPAMLQQQIHPYLQGYADHNYPQNIMNYRPSMETEKYSSFPSPPSSPTSAAQSASSSASENHNNDHEKSGPASPFQQANDVDAGPEEDAAAAGGENKSASPQAPSGNTEHAEDVFDVQLPQHQPQHDHHLLHAAPQHSHNLSSSVLSIPPIHSAGEVVTEDAELLLQPNQQQQHNSVMAGDDSSWKLQQGPIPPPSPPQAMFPPLPLSPPLPSPHQQQQPSGNGIWGVGPPHHNLGQPPAPNGIASQPAAAASMLWYPQQQPQPQQLQPPFQQQQPQQTVYQPPSPPPLSPPLQGSPFGFPTDPMMLQPPPSPWSANMLPNLFAPPTSMNNLLGLGPDLSPQIAPPTPHNPFLPSSAGNVVGPPPVVLASPPAQHSFPQQQQYQVVAPHSQPWSIHEGVAPPEQASLRSAQVCRDTGSLIGLMDCLSVSTEPLRTKQAPTIPAAENAADADVKTTLPKMPNVCSWSGMGPSPITTNSGFAADTYHQSSSNSAEESASLVCPLYSSPDEAIPFTVASFKTYLGEAAAESGPQRALTDAFAHFTRRPAGRVPSGEFALALNLEGQHSSSNADPRRTAILQMDIECQQGNGQLEFDYWSTSDKLALKVCTRLPEERRCTSQIVYSGEDARVEIDVVDPYSSDSPSPSSSPSANYTAHIVGGKRGSASKGKRRFVLELIVSDFLEPAAFIVDNLRYQWRPCADNQLASDKDLSDSFTSSHPQHQKAADNDLRRRLRLLKKLNFLGGSPIKLLNVDLPAARRLHSQLRRRISSSRRMAHLAADGKIMESSEKGYEKVELPPPSYSSLIAEHHNSKLPSLNKENQPPLTPIFAAFLHELEPHFVAAAAAAAGSPADMGAAIKTEKLPSAAGGGGGGRRKEISRRLKRPLLPSSSSSTYSVVDYVSSGSKEGGGGKKEAGLVKSQSSALAWGKQAHSSSRGQSNADYKQIRISELSPCELLNCDFNEDLCHYTVKTTYPLPTSLSLNDIGEVVEGEKKGDGGGGKVRMGRWKLVKTSRRPPQQQQQRRQEKGTSSLPLRPEMEEKKNDDGLLDSRVAYTSQQSLNSGSSNLHHQTHNSYYSGRGLASNAIERRKREPNGFIYIGGGGGAGGMTVEVESNPLLNITSLRPTSRSRLSSAKIPEQYEPEPNTPSSTSTTTTTTILYILESAPFTLDAEGVLTFDLYHAPHSAEGQNHDLKVCFNNSNSISSSSSSSKCVHFQDRAPHLNEPGIFWRRSLRVALPAATKKVYFVGEQQQQLSSGQRHQHHSSSGGYVTGSHGAWLAIDNIRLVQGAKCMGKSNETTEKKEEEMAKNKLM